MPDPGGGTPLPLRTCEPPPTPLRVQNAGRSGRGGTRTQETLKGLAAFKAVHRESRDLREYARRAL